jgi:chemotaxis protein MotA
MPIVSKLEQYSTHELVYRTMVVMGLKFISRGESPRNITDQLVANLPPKLQAKIEEAA